MLSAGVFLFGTSRRVDGVVDGGFVMAAVPPRLGNVQARFVNRWVLVTGRFGDSVARSCRAKGAPGETPTHAETVRICRSVLVISSIDPLAAPQTAMADDAAPWAGIEPWRVVAWLVLAVAFALVAVTWLRDRLRRI
jgi:hypothetical protein